MSQIKALDAIAGLLNTAGTAIVVEFGIDSDVSVAVHKAATALRRARETLDWAVSLRHAEEQRDADQAEILARINGKVGA